MDTFGKAKSTPATQKTENAAAKIETKEKKPRMPAVSFGDKVKVLALVKEGKGTVEELVATGLDRRVATVSLKTLLKEKMIKQSYVAV